MQIKEEKRTVEKMIRLHCRHKHKQPEGMCTSCSALLQYTYKKLDNCRYADSKPSCRKCPTHCYAPQQREEIKKIMRYAGPRLLLYEPLAYFKHLFK